MDVLSQGTAGPTRSSVAGRPDVAVVYTAAEPTRAALRKAAALVCGLDTRIRLLVPRIVPYPLSLDQPAVADAFSEERLSSLLPDSVDAWIDVRICRDFVPGLLSALRPDSIVVIATPRGWWLAWEKRLARRLEKRRHEVLRVPC